MKYLLFLIASSVPIMYVSGTSLTGVLKGPAAAADAGAAPVIPEAVLQEKQAAAKQDFDAAAAADAECKPLWKCELVERTVAAAPAANDERVKVFFKNSTTAKLALMLATDYADEPKLLDPKLTESKDKDALAKFEVDLRKLATDIKASPAAELPLVEPLAKKLTDQADLCKTRVGELTKTEGVEKVLELVRIDLADKKFTDAIAKLETDQVKNAPDPASKTAAADLLRRAKFGQAADRLLTEAKSDGSEAQLQRIEDFLSANSSPHEAERSLVDQLAAQRDKLRYVAAKNRITNAESLGAALTAAERILDGTDVSSVVREDVRKLVEAWLRSSKGLQEIREPVSLKGMVEVGLTQGRRRIGIIEPTEGVGGYTYWTDNGQKRALPKGARIYAQEVVADVNSPYYVRLAQRYNTAVRGLMTNGGTEQAWKEFALECDTLNEDRDNYLRNIVPAEAHASDNEARGWDFKQPKTVAEDVVRHWTAYARVMGK